MALTRPRDTLKRRLASLQGEILLILSQLSPDDIQALEIEADDDRIYVHEPDYCDFVADGKAEVKITRNEDTYHLSTKWLYVLNQEDGFE